MRRRSAERTKPKQRLLTEHAVDALLDKLRARAAQQLTDDDHETLTGVVQTWAHLTELTGRKTASIREIRQVLGLSEPREHRAGRSPDERGEPAPDVDPPGVEGDAEAEARDAIESQGVEAAKNRDPHGRRSDEDFEQLEQAHHAHLALSSGDTCPCCHRGRVYKYRLSVFTTISGRSPLVATRHTVEALQCNLCKETFRVPLPAALQADGVVNGQVLYTFSAVAMVCIVRCFGGMPMYRQDRPQRALGVPVPDASIWDLHERLAAAVRPVWRYLVTQAANAPLFFGDDMGATILSSRTKVLPNRRTGELQQRTGCHTTCVIAVVDDGQAASPATRVRRSTTTAWSGRCERASACARRRTSSAIRSAPRWRTRS